MYHNLKIILLILVDDSQVHNPNIFFQRKNRNNPLFEDFDIDKYLTYFLYSLISYYEFNSQQAKKLRPLYFEI